MLILSFFISIFINLVPSSNFICDGDVLNVTIRNNLNGDYTIINDLNLIDEGAFVNLHWRDLNLMLPRTFNYGEISFTDRKWWWSYKDREKGEYINSPELRQRMPSGEIIDYSCKVE